MFSPSSDPVWVRDPNAPTLNKPRRLEYPAPTVISVALHVFLRIKTAYIVFVAFPKPPSSIDTVMLTAACDLSSLLMGLEWKLLVSSLFDIVLFMIEAVPDGP